MDLRHLRALVAVIEHGHFGRAAESLHLAQPALSQHVKQLERELGVTLLDRTTRRVSVTEAGTRFVGHARTVLADVETAYADMALLATGQVGRVSVGFVGTATYDVLPRVAQELRATLPRLELDLRGELLSPALVAGVLDRTFDLALVRPGDVPDGLTVDHLRSEPLIVALPRTHRLARRRRLQLAELRDEPFVAHPSRERSAMHGALLAACAAAGFQPRVVAEAAETATLMVLVASGQGVALVPEPVRSLGLDGVTYVALSRAPTIDLALVRRSEGLTPAARLASDIVVGAVT